MKNKHFDLKLKKEIKNEFIVTGMFPNMAWVDGKATDTQNGWKLRTICPSASYEETIIKVDTDKLPLDAEKLEGEPALVAFNDLEFTSYFSSVTKRQEFTGKASGLRILKSATE